MSSHSIKLISYQIFGHMYMHTELTLWPPTAKILAFAQAPGAPLPLMPMINCMGQGMVIRDCLFTYYAMLQSSQSSPIMLNVLLM